MKQPMPRYPYSSGLTMTLNCVWPAGAVVIGWAWQKGKQAGLTAPVRS